VGEDLVQRREVDRTVARTDELRPDVSRPLEKRYQNLGARLRPQPTCRGGVVEQDEVIELGTRDLPGLRPEAVTAWLDENTPVRSPVEYGLIAAGGSNLTYRLVDADGARWVLRRPPVGTLLETAHDMEREARILSGLGATAVPVPEVVGTCTDPTVNGTAFFVMRYVEGRILRTEAMGTELGPDAAATAGSNFFETLALIHTTPPTAAGLDGLSRPDGYVERQLRRWHGQYAETAADGALPLEAELHDRLRDAVPPDEGSGTSHLVHGDYHIDNVVLGADLAVVAVFDWELATLGHPIADLAWALMFWAQAGDDDAFLPDPPSRAPGFPTRDEAVEIYARAAGADVERMRYFEAFSRWKMACLLSGSLHRSERGSGGGMQAGGRAAATDQRARIAEMFQRAHDLLR
jgi:aminoglycoside phosphotransferase (APT) family kinase protein